VTDRLDSCGEQTHQAQLTKQLNWSITDNLLLHWSNILVLKICLQEQKNDCNHNFVKIYWYTETIQTQLTKLYILINCQQFIVTQKQYLGSGFLLLITKKYKHKWQTIWIVVENKNIHAQLTTQLNWSMGKTGKYHHLGVRSWIIYLRTILTFAASHHLF
jgi:hypothetical protein